MTPRKTPMSRSTIHVALVLAAAAAGASCSRSFEKRSVAGVNGREIMVQDIVLQYRRMNPTVRPFVDTFEGKRGFLNDMINRELMLQEAEARGLTETPELAALLQRFENGLLAEKFYLTNFRRKVEVTDQELRDLYERRGEEARLRLILAASQETAGEVRQALERGDDFITLARQRSVDHSKNRGGDLGVHTWADYPEEFTAAARGLQAGQVTPVFPYQGGFALLRLEDRRPVPQDDYATEDANLRRQLREIKELRAVREWTARKQREIGLQIDSTAVAILSTAMRSAIASRVNPTAPSPLPVADTDKTRTLATFAGKTWTLDDYLFRLESLPPEARPKLSSPHAELAVFIGNLVVRDVSVEEARKQGLQKSPELVEAVERFREKQMITRLHFEIAKPAEIPEEDIRRYYEEHQASLIAPARVKVRVAVLSTEEEAKEALGRLRKRETSLLRVATEESVDLESAAEEGEIWVTRTAEPSMFEQRVFASDGERVEGPIRVPGGWALFRNLEEEGESPMRYEEAHDMIRDTIVEETRIRRFDDWLAERREKAKIEIHEDVLRQIQFGAPDDQRHEGEQEPATVSTS